MTCIRRSPRKAIRFTRRCTTRVPHGLLELVEDTSPFDSREFVSKCHLCLEIRKALAKSGKFEELSAKGFYGI